MEWLFIHLVLLTILLAINQVIFGLRDSLKCPVRVLRGGRVQLRSKGRVAKYVCLRRYQVLGDKYSACVRGKWDTPLPVCISSGCMPVDVPHGQVLETYRGALLTVHCDPGYTLIGSQSIYCNGAVWNDTAPTCREDQVTAQKWCDFESEDLCGWTHDQNHDFDWRRHNFATPSGHVGTGPSFDHTLGPGLNGHYMYLEVSSPRLQNDTARLFSPVFNAISDPGACFIFWYHMYGSSTGTLNVYLHKQDTVLLFNKSGDQGNQWLQAVIPLPETSSSFQIVMEGVRGASYDGDIAIDDVKLAEGAECAVSLNITPAGDTETTTEDVHSSCEGRCFLAAREPSMCECTQDCISNNTCCPDYVHKCAAGTPDVTTESEITKVQPNISTEAIKTNSKIETSIVMHTTTPNLPTTTKNNSATSIPDYPTSYKPLISKVTSETHQNESASFNITPSTKSPFTTVAKPPIIVLPTTINLPVTSQTEAKLNTTSRVSTTFSLLPNMTKSTNAKMSSIGFTTKSSVQFTKSTKSQAKTPQITLKPKIEFVTLPPPIVFRNPKTIGPFTKYVRNTTIPTSTLVTTQSPKRFFNRTEKVPKSKNDVLHPVWVREPPKMPKLPPLGPKPTNLANKTTSVSYPTTALPNTTSHLTTALHNTTLNHPPTDSTSSASPRWKSKYKPREEEPVHAGYAVSSSPTSQMVHIIVLVSGVLVILIMALATVCVVRRRRINRRRMEDDELDIQFLPPDEMLDFTLARPSMEDIQMKETRR
ncbi:zonadhesin-like [Macrosteles quadrilineatus]|uniref:zonadhesin-like n=1 Tax=Macrosteles quadrilineatus TaxID=74068 RepID=UPI0023E12051|nr:zonadhesin-like [Macrosteles quadrilineatus]